MLQQDIITILLWSYFTDIDTDLLEWTQKSGLGSAALMLSLVPSFKLSEQKTELIFLVDRSGSMQGAGIKQAGQALKVL